MNSWGNQWLTQCQILKVEKWRKGEDANMGEDNLKIKWEWRESRENLLKGPRLGILKKETWYLPHMPQRNSDLMALCMRMPVGLQLWTQWVCKGQWTPRFSASSLFYKAGVPLTAFYNSLSTACPGIAILFSVYLEGWWAFQREAEDHEEGSWVSPHSSAHICHHHITLHLRFAPPHNNKPAFPPAQSSFILRCGGAQFKPEIKSQECPAAKLVE